MAYHQDYVGMEDINMDEFGNFDAQNYWTGEHDGSSEAIMAHDLMDFGLANLDQQLQPPAPMMLWDAHQSSSSEGYGIALGTSPQTLSRVVQGEYGTAQEGALATDHRDTSPAGFEHQQAGLLSPQSMVYGMKYEEMGMPSQDGSVNRDMPRSVHGILQSPAIYSPRLLPSVAQTAQIGVARGESFCLIEGSRLRHKACNTVIAVTCRRMSHG
jgi:hypothetical protein